MVLFGILFLASVIAIAIYLTPGEEKVSIRREAERDTSFGWADKKPAIRPASFAARLCTALDRGARSA